MNENEEYEFWIDAYSPETISMKRLGEYMTRLGKLLGQDDRVHFHELRKGSTVVALKIEREAAPKVEQRIENIKTAEASSEAMAAEKELNDMLRSDNAIGEFRKITTGLTAKILKFSGREIPKPQKIGPFSEPVILKGELFRLEGKDATKHAGIIDAQGRTWSGVMPLEIAVHSRELMWEWVAVSGTAKWTRSEEGVWDLMEFQITSCEALPKDELADDLQRLRTIADNQWKKMKDPIGFIHESRNDDDEVH